jgi:hypothetical protein
MVADRNTKVNEKICSWPWLPNNSNKKGLKDPQLFITMLSTVRPRVWENPDLRSGLSSLLR